MIRQCTLAQRAPPSFLYASISVIHVSSRQLFFRISAKSIRQAIGMLTDTLGSRPDHDPSFSPRLPVRARQVFDAGRPHNDASASTGAGHSSSPGRTLVRRSVAPAHTVFDAIHDHAGAAPYTDFDDTDRDAGVSKLRS